MKQIIKYAEHLDVDNSVFNIMRIYRDIRFSKDKTPYKTWLGIVFWHGDRKKTENPGFYFGLDHEGAHLHCGWHRLPKEALHAFRAAVVDDQTGSELEGILLDICTEHARTMSPAFRWLLNLDQN